MSRIVVCGGSVIGLATAMMLAADGHEVTVLEADSESTPPEGPGTWETWRRRGVAQFRQPHSLLSRFRLVCDEELPGLTDRLRAAGCLPVDYVRHAPPSIADRGPRPGDERLMAVTGRRPVVESVVAAAAAEHRGVEVRRGVRVAELCLGTDVVPGVPHLTGVRTVDGAEFPADLVVDAMGRRTPSARWLSAAGAPNPPVAEGDRGFVYYTRYFTAAQRPERRGPPLQPMGSVSLLTIDSDNDTWSVTVFGLSDDAPLKSLRDPDVFTRVASLNPKIAPFLDGKPISDVVAMAGIMDRHRRFAVDGLPVATGFAAVGDAWACTNPSAGRGLAVGLLHAQTLRRVVRDHLDDPATFALEWDARTEQDVAPFVHDQFEVDAVRVAEMDAIRHGKPPLRVDSPTARLATVARSDPEAFRGLLEIFLCTALPAEVFARPGIAELLEKADAEARPHRAAGPEDRARLLAALEP
ncbi:FAD-dependent oxidoreductase [Amycolatopsis sp. WGS_07]|uniref:FAD-dependent oxidoreductase n=1 Tax=Amycolatopsis sp. WGS_07 TaxID=3076764 RepID=UPI003872BC5F